MQRIKKILLYLMMFMFSTTAVGAENSGVATHMCNWGPKVTRDIQDMNIEWVRDLLDWREVEKTAGELKLPDGLKEGYKKLADKGVKIIVCFGCGNPIYNDEASHRIMPTVDDEEYMQSWLNYVEYVVTELKGIVYGYEIWNEPNVPTFNTNASGSDYGKMFAETYKVIDNADKEALVIGGSVVATDESDLYAWNFTKNFYNNGGSCMDGFSFHAYTYGAAPEVLWKKVNMAEMVLTELGYTGSVWMTECGYYTGTYSDDSRGFRAATDEEQCSYLLRLNAMWEDYVHRTGRDGKFFWFSAIDIGSDINNPEQNFGLLSSGYIPKKSYYSMQRYENSVKDRNFINLDKSGNCYSAKYENTDGAQTYLVWNTDGDNTNGEDSVNIIIPTRCDVFSVYNCDGFLAEREYDVSGNCVVTANEYTKIITCDNYYATIDSFEYNSTYNKIHISGKTNFKDSINIEVYDGDTLIQTLRCDVIDDTYDAKFYVEASGLLTVCAGKSFLQQLNKTGWAEKKVTIGGNSSISVAASYDSENKTVTVSGKLENNTGRENVTVLAVPEMVSPDNITASNIAYIGMIESEGTFVHTFKMPGNSEGKYTIYAGSTNMDQRAQSALVTGEESEFVRVCDISLEDTDFIMAAADINNTSALPKSAEIIIAQYDNFNKLIDVKSKSVKIDGGVVQPQRLELQCSSVDNVKTIVAYLFDSLTGMHPLSEKITVERGGINE